MILNLVKYFCILTNYVIFQGATVHPVNFKPVTVGVAMSNVTKSGIVAPKPGQKTVQCIL